MFTHLLEVHYNVYCLGDYCNLNDGLLFNCITYFLRGCGGDTVIVVDCIDCAADASVVSAVNEGIEAAMTIVSVRRPWVMISVNDDEDLHFRKAGDC